MNGQSVLDTLSVVGNAAALFELTSGIGQGVKVEGLVGASLVATTGGAAVTSTAGKITLTAAADLELSFLTGELILEPLPADFTNVTSNAAAAGPTYAGSNLKQLKIKIGETDYWIALNPSAFA